MSPWLWPALAAALAGLALALAWPRLRRALIRSTAAPATLREFAAATLAQGGVGKMLLYHALLPFVDRRLPRPCVTWLCRTIGGAEGIDFSELERPLETYATLGEFFVRDIAAERRPPCPAAGVAVSPADCEVVAQGRIDADQLFEAKGMPYRLADLLPVPEAARFVDGDYLSLYLRPSDCHRVFCPVDDARVHAAVGLAGGEMPVAPVVRELVSGIYVHNKRVAHLLRTPQGDVALVMIGAFKVGRIASAYDPRPWRVLEEPAPARERRDYAPEVALARGDWLATFHLGSSIVLLFERGRFRPDAGLAGRRLRYGERLGTFGSR